MFRALARIILVVVILVAVAAFFTGYRWGGWHRPATATTAEPAARPAEPTGTSGRADTTREKARAAGAQIGETVAVGAERAAETLQEAQLTAKVKSKIALDDTLEGSRIHVSNEDQRVTLTGTVLNDAQHARALALTRETSGVAGVVEWAPEFGIAG